MDKNNELENTLENSPELEDSENKSGTELETELDAELDNSEKDLTSEDSDEIKSLREQLNKAESAKNQLYARIKKLESKNKVEKTNEDDWKERIEFLVKRRDFDVDELEIVEAFAKGSGKSLEEAAKNPAVQAAIDSIRQKKATEKASLASSSRSDSSDNSLISKWKAGKLSEEEFRKNFREVQKEFVSKKKGTASYE
ncbi:MAG TPA: hypothetical protein DFI01_01010 [Bacteroidales bacterium]|nr:hypothetical protein [Bacteroidales bacterium]